MTARKVTEGQLANKETKIFVVDDDPLAMGSLKLVLSPHYSVTGFTDPDRAEAAAREEAPRIALLDLNFPDHNGMSLLQKWRHQFPDTEVISCSGEIRVQRAMECLRRGASDYLVKPFQAEDLLRVVERTLNRRELPRQPSIDFEKSGFIGSSASVQAVLEKVRLLRRQPHMNVLILGESGTGKELIARLLHVQEGNAKRPFVVSNMAAIPANLLESEFFGVERGAFTDAKASRPGKFELAHKGDIFLDEIGDLPLDTQAKILRVLQEKQIQRLGSHEVRQVSFRTIAATNRPLADLVAEGAFREDLMYRLTDMVLWLPALRERPEDIPALARHFVAKYSGGGEPLQIADEAIAYLQGYHWPGNVRQLESTIKRAMIFCRGRVLREIEIFDPATLVPSRAKGVQALESQKGSFEKELIEAALRRNGGDRGATIEELKLSKATFYRKVNQLNIPLP